MRPPMIWKPGASMSRSRKEPLVTQPSAPSALCTAVCTSPQKAPKPGRSSRSCSTAIVGKSARRRSRTNPAGRVRGRAAFPSHGSCRRARGRRSAAAFRSAATIGSTVKPIARRSGTTISSPLQIVGVSQLAGRRGRRGEGPVGHAAVLPSKRCGRRTQARRCRWRGGRRRPTMSATRRPVIAPAASPTWPWPKASITSPQPRAGRSPAARRACSAGVPSRP